MRRFTRLALAACVFSLPVHADEIERVMAVTVDDLPVVSTVDINDAERWRITDALLTALDDHKAPAVGFVNEFKLYDGDERIPSRVALLESWLEAGFELGNHTWSHPDLHTIELDAYLENILKGEQVTRPLMAEHDMSLRWFRHPFLHTGRDAATRKAVRDLLAGHDYRVAPVTLDNGEWIYSRAYDQARGDAPARRRIREAYVDYMLDVVAYYEDQSVQFHGRNIPHVLLLHANALNADSLGTLLSLIAERGYRFATLENVVADPVYDSADEYFGAGGITWLHRWALTAGHRGKVFAGEPEVPEWIRAWPES